MQTQRGAETGWSWDELAERARQVALGARHEARELEARRVALSRFALVWWHGGAAESYRLRVHERVNALARLAGELDGLAGVADRLAERAGERAAAEVAGAAAGMRR